MKTNTFGFIGGGRITRLLLQALKHKNALPKKVLVADPDEAMRERVKRIDAAAIEGMTNNLNALNVDILFLAVHPPKVNDVMAEIGGKINSDTIVVSLIPVINIKTLSTCLGDVTKIVRMIPNAPSIIHRGFNPVVYSDGITQQEKQQLQQLFSYWGEATEVDEQKLEAYAIITAMGPTYFWFQWLKLHDLGKQFGMNDAELKQAMPAMLHGAVATLFESDLSPEEVMDLIPVCPLKEEELTIKNMFDTKLTGLFTKLTKN